MLPGSALGRLLNAPAMHSFTLRTSLALIALSLFGLTACDPETTTDAGTDGGIPTADTPPTPDVPRDTRPAGGTCADVRTVTLTMGENTITGDTTGRPMDQTLSCAAFMASPQEAIQFTVPGSPGDTIAVDLTTAVDGTAFDTLIEVRPTCMDADNGICEDDIDYPDEPRTNLTVAVPGGTTLVAIITGYGTDNVGPWTMRATIREANPPTITSATATLDETTLTVSATGGDVDGDAAGVVVEFLNAAGDPITLTFDGGGTASEFPFDFDESVDGMTTFTGETVVGGLDEFPELADTMTVRVRIYDRAALESDSVLATTILATTVGLGEACDGVETVCAPGLACEADVCALTPEVVAVCATSTALTLAAFPSATEASVTTVTPAPSIAVDEGVLTAPCQDNTPGAEALYSLTIPAGNFDLLVTTAGTTTGETDTVVYVMSTCGDTFGAAEDYCADDVDDEDLSSALEIRDIPSGDYTLAFEVFGEIKAAADIDAIVTVRPVLDAGAACDPAGVTNRCSTGTCPSSAMCPAAP